MVSSTYSYISGGAVSKKGGALNKKGGALNNIRAEGLMVRFGTSSCYSVTGPRKRQAASLQQSSHQERLRN